MPGCGLREALGLMLNGLQAAKGASWEVCVSTLPVQGSILISQALESIYELLSSSQGAG
jgi:hypothetical protein